MGIALGYTGSANWVILFLPLVWSVLTYRDIGMGKPLLLFTLVVALMSLFLPGRDDEMLSNNPALYLDVQSWFMLG